MKTLILPGMGADSTLFPKDSFAKLNNVLFAEWPPYEGESSLREVAEKIIEQHNIDREMVVGGASLGGMIAIEIAKLAKIEKIILIGSATAPHYINPILQKLSNLAATTPIEMLQLFAGKLNLHKESALLTMFEKSESQFIQAMCKALFQWEGQGDYNCEICHIHGKKDKVIFPPPNNVEIIPDGGHLISMTHGNTVAEYIDKSVKLHITNKIQS